MGQNEVIVKLPEGDYCENCKFLEYYDFPLVDIMGNETGNRKSGYKCRLNNDELQVENFGCYQRIKKSFWCKATEEEKFSMGLAFLALFGMMNSDKFGKDKDKQNTVHDKGE